MLNTVHPSKRAIHEWTNAYGDWLTVGTHVWKLAHNRIDRSAPLSAEVRDAFRRLDEAHERLKRALVGL